MFFVVKKSIKTINLIIISYLQVSQELSTKTYNSLTMVTKSVLTFSSLSSGQYGQYKCVADFGGTTVESQVATITETGKKFPFFYLALHCKGCWLVQFQL